MEFDLLSLTPTERYKLLTHVIVPRPIAWVTTLNKEGKLNAAPFSFFNVFGSKPPLVALGIGNRPDDGTPKDTARNIRETREFVINMVTEKLAEKMVLTSYEFEHGHDELEQVGLNTERSTRVAPPRIAACPIALECREHSTQLIGENRLIIGEILHAHIDDAFFDPETDKVLTENIGLVGRMHGPAGYCTTQDLFEIARPKSHKDPRFPG